MPQPLAPIPPGAVLFHVGPYKTGTTAIQASLTDGRDEVAALGVHYPAAKFTAGTGDENRQARASWALLGRAPAGVEDVPDEEWEALVADVNRARAEGARVVLSSEDFASMGPRHAARVVEAFGAENIHPVVVARRLHGLLPSSWQQRVKSSNETRSYSDWLEEVLDKGRSGAAAKAFWHNQSMRRIAALWRELVPAEQITLVVTDESDRSQQTRVFEELLALPHGTLKPSKRPNTSLSFPRAEFLRQVNVAAREAGWSESYCREVVYRGLLPRLRDAANSPADVALPPLPEWAAQEVRSLDLKRVESVRGSGVVVVGDPAWLAVENPTSGSTEAPTEVSVEAATAAVIGALAQTQERQKKAVRKAAAKAKRAQLAPAPTPAPPTPLDRARRLAGRVRRRFS